MIWNPFCNLSTRKKCDAAKAWRKKGSSEGRQIYGKKKQTCNRWLFYDSAVLMWVFARSCQSSFEEYSHSLSQADRNSSGKVSAKLKESRIQVTQDRQPSAKSNTRMYGDANRTETTWEMTASPSSTSSSLHLYDKWCIITIPTSTMWLGPWRSALALRTLWY